VVIELKGLEPGQSAAFSDRTGFFYESSYNGYILPILGDALRGDTWSKSWEFYKKITAGKINLSNDSLYLFNPCFNGNKEAQKYLLSLYINTGGFLKYLSYINDNFDHQSHFHNQTLCEILSVVLRNTKNDKHNRLFCGYAKLNNSYSIMNPSMMNSIYIFESSIIFSGPPKFFQNEKPVEFIPLMGIKKYVAFFNGIKIEMKDRATLWFGNECNKIDLDKPSLGYNLRIHFEKHAKESGLSPKK